MSAEPSKPRIVLMIGTLAIGGGAEKVTAALATGLTERGYEVHIVTFYKYEDEYPFKAANYHSFHEVLHTNRLYKLLNLPRRLWQIQKYMRKHKIDTVISFLEEANFYALIAKIVFFLPQRIIVSVRINIQRRELPFRIGTRLLYPLAQKVVSVTRGIEHILKHEYGLQNVCTIYNPLDVRQARVLAQEPLPQAYAWIETKNPVFISNGRYTHQKGWWHLIRAFGAVRKKYPNAILLILGDGDMKEKIQKLIKTCALEDAIFLLGRHRNVYSFLNAADIFVFSSLYEGMPNAMLEAAALGLPIVSAECLTGPREIIAPELTINEKVSYPYRGSRGILTQPLSSDEIWESTKSVPLTEEEQELSNTMVAVASHPTRVSYELAEFNPDHVIDQWEALLRERYTYR